MRLLSIVFLALAPVVATPVWADDDPVITEVIDTHILPRMEVLVGATEALKTADCDADALRPAFHEAMDAWTAVSHLRFGPSETDNRAFAIAFWPDPRAKTPKVLGRILTSEASLAPADFAKESIAARGIYALEFLLFDEGYMAETPRRCALIRAISDNLATQATAIRDDWRNTYRATMLSYSDTAPYRSSAEARQELFKAMQTGLEFASATRLGRPLGTFDRPRPKRAELRRSARSLRQIEVTTESLRDIAMILSRDFAGQNAELRAKFDVLQERIKGLDDPTFAGVSDPVARLKIEILQQIMQDIHEYAELELAPRLGVAAGFNALDGD